MKSARIVTAAMTLVMGAYGAQAQGLQNYLNDAKKGMDKIKTGATTVAGTSGTGTPSQSEIAAGLKQALEVGAQTATSKVSAANGFFGNSIIKILMPPEAKKVETTLRNLGMGSYVDKAILSMNRAAEDASKKALPIFVDAIKGITINDGMSILRGSNDAATQYLKGKTTPALTSAFRPVIQSSLDKVNATAYWQEVFTIYNKLPTTRTPVNPDLAGYVTERALSGVFVNIADEELKIRTDPAARVTDLLKKVFGFK
jgi:hypothetical protein